jgi:predicted Zn finger-like uncharacterized protein
MYTQCPECQTAFRITATVLKQAAGRVRCGGCGKAFNAIEHLSEEPPRISPSTDMPQTVPAPPDREMLEELDQLAGSEEVRIEDTGIEWRVLGDEDTTDSGTPEDDGGSTRWFVESPTGAGRDSLPVAIEEIDIAETGDTAAHRTIDTQTALDLEGVEVPGNELRFDDNTPLPDDFDDLDDRFEAVPTPRRRAEDADDPAPPEFMEAQHDLELSAPEEWEGLLSEMVVGDDPARGIDDREAAVAEDITVVAGHDGEADLSIAVEEETTPADDIDADTGDDKDNGLSIEVEEELAAIHSELSFRPAPKDAFGDIERVTAGDEHGDDEALLDADEDAFDFEALLDEDDTRESDRTGSFRQPGTGGDDESDEGLSLSETDSSDGIDFDESTGEFREKIAAAEHALRDGEFRGGAAAADADEDRATDDEDEREKTVNLQIDEELLRAMEDEEFAATMTSEDGSPLVETIIMEGDFITASIDADRNAAENSARHHVPEGASLADTYMLSREKEKSRFRLTWPGKGVVAGILLLLLLLAGQFVHNSREWLATYGTFNQTLGPVYRTLGSPVRPQWDIRGWRFETTSGGTDETGSTLTIQSRIANRSQSSLPYPLVHVSLTDRWEETIGSRVLEPKEYLAGNADPRRPLAPGERFTAVITIESPSPDATGFKLNVCYRESPGVVRCAIEDFKD